MNYRILSRMLFKPLESLYINMPPEKIGGLYIQHGFSTIMIYCGLTPLREDKLSKEFINTW